MKIEKSYSSDQLALKDFVRRCPDCQQIKEELATECDVTVAAVDRWLYEKLNRNFRRPIKAAINKVSKRRYGFRIFKEEGI